MYYLQVPALTLTSNYSAQKKNSRWVTKQEGQDDENHNIFDLLENILLLETLWRWENTLTLMIEIDTFWFFNVLL